MPVTDVDAGRLDADEHIVVADLGRIDLLEPQDIGGHAVLVLNNRPHLASRRPDLVVLCCHLLLYRTHELLLIQCSEADRPPYLVQ
jgi:hypothetical protein